MFILHVIKVLAYDGGKSPVLYCTEFGRNCSGTYIGYPHSIDGQMEAGEAQVGDLLSGRNGGVSVPGSLAPTGHCANLLAFSPGQEVVSHGSSWRAPRPVPRPQLNAPSEPRVQVE